MGYSDTTVNHFMMYKAGIVSFYGPSIMAEFAQYMKMLDYTKQAVHDILFGDWNTYELKSSEVWSEDYIPWLEENRERELITRQEEHGYEVINGIGKTCGKLLGGCFDVFMMIIGTSIWPSLEEWRDTILFFETSEEKPSPDFIIWTLRNFAAMGILGVIRGIMIGKPMDEVYYEEYKQSILQVVVEEEKLVDLPIFYNINFGHAKPIGIIPYGILTELDCEHKTITFLESATI